MLGASAAHAECEKPAIPGLTVDGPGRNSDGESYHVGAGKFEVMPISRPEGAIVKLTVGLSAGSETPVIFTDVGFTAEPIYQHQQWSYMPEKARIVMDNASQTMVVKAGRSGNRIYVRPGYMDEMEWAKRLKRAKTASVTIDDTEGHSRNSYIFDVSNFRRVEAQVAAYWRCANREFGILED